jgi:hypothetical protein
MIVITADQIDSTHREDLAGATVARLNAEHGDKFALPVDRNAGDEIQAMLDDARTALTVVLELTRRGQWSVGCGIGPVRTPLPDNTREATGPAFVAARSAVDQAKRAAHHFALALSDDPLDDRMGIAPLIELLLVIRARRTPEGWELYDLVAGGMTQAQAAHALGISPQAASQRARAAGIRAEFAALPALARLLEQANAPEPSDE